jgi:U3 small nucleolar RNA-associated protein 12
VEIFRIRTEEEIQKKQARRKKRTKAKKEKDPDTAASKGKGSEVTNIEEDQEIDPVDLFTPYLIVRASGKIRSFDFSKEDKTPANKGYTQVRTTAS